MKKAVSYCVFTGVFLLLFFCTASGRAHFFGDKKELLREIASFRVFVAALAPEAKKAGLAEEILKTDVEFQFKTAGIEVSDSSNTGIYVKLDTLCLENSKQFVYNLRIDLLDVVVLIRKPEVSCHASTWSESKTGIISQAKMVETIRKHLINEIDLLIYEYRTVNPKE